ncbi:MAG: hypothetical protein ACRD0N_13440 [Acidimicrobiales bacterium]
MHDFREEDLETTGRMEPPKPEAPSLRMRVTEEGDASVVNEDGTTSGIPYPDETNGLPFFSYVDLYEFMEPGDLAPSGVIVGKAEKPDGAWHYAVLYVDAKQVIGPMERDRLHVSFGTEPGEFLDFGRRPPGIDDFERDFPHFLGAWLAPAPAFGYDQEVRVLDRPHTEEVAGRVGAVMCEELHDDLTWSYWVLFHDSPAAPYQSATVAQEDLEPTGRFGEGYNPPPDWLR